MKFGPVPLDQAEGAILAHAVWAGDLRLRKSHVLTAADLAELRAAGVAELIVARLEPGDLDEDEAASRVARLFAGPHLDVKTAATGRVNIHAARAGVLSVDKPLIDAINRVDPAITVATLGEYSAVESGRMVATIKIIPYAVAGAQVARVETLAAGRAGIALHPFRALRIGLVQTVLPGSKPSVLDKTARATAARLARSGGSIIEERRPAHDAAALAHDIAELARRTDMVIAFGASAMSDPDDVAPMAIRLAGGEVHRVGMPVDPGNLIVVGEVAGKPVLGAPGCARSPKENGFDWVLDRIVSGLGVTADDIAGMGVGGLLMEIPTRPQPREAPPPTQTVHAIVLAAGRSSRMGGPNKLMARFDGVPLIRRTVERALASRAAGVTVVTGHEAGRIGEALAGLDVEIVHNPDFATGLASSLATGVAHVPASAAGAMIVLGDMPEVSVADLDRLIAAFASGAGAAARATHAGKRGNPVILPRALFPRVSALTGDTGARHVLEEGTVEVIDVELGPAASLDVDTPEAMERAGGREGVRC